VAYSEKETFGKRLSGKVDFFFFVITYFHVTLHLIE